MSGAVKCVEMRSLTSMTVIVRDLENLAVHYCEHGTAVARVLVKQKAMEDGTSFGWDGIRRGGRHVFIADGRVQGRCRYHISSNETKTVRGVNLYGNAYMTPSVYKFWSRIGNYVRTPGYVRPLWGRRVNGTHPYRM
jgi:hypothetical protein